MINVAWWFGLIVMIGYTALIYIQIFLHVTFFRIFPYAPSTSLPNRHLLKKRFPMVLTCEFFWFNLFKFLPSLNYCYHFLTFNFCLKIFLPVCLFITTLSLLDLALVNSQIAQTLGLFFTPKWRLEDHFILGQFYETQITRNFLFLFRKLMYSINSSLTLWT